MDKQYINLVWKSPVSGSNYVVGELTNNSEFCFKYCDDIDEAIKEGFKLLPSFKDKNKIYTSQNMFSVFSSRLPDKKRRDIYQILKKNKLEMFDEFELLKRSGGKTATDSMFFINPIENDGKPINREFSLSGVKHYLKCNGENCSNFKGDRIKIGDKLILQKEPENKYDKYAVKVLHNNELLGYIPRYYSKEIYRRLDNGSTYKCSIYSINKNRICTECVNIELYMDNYLKSTEQK